MRLFDVLPNFPLPQVKRRAIITYEHSIYVFTHELPNDLNDPRELGTSEKCLNSIEC